MNADRGKTGDRRQTPAQALGGWWSFGRLARFRRLARDYERTAEVLVGWHRVARTELVLTRVMGLPRPGS